MYFSLCLEARFYAVCIQYVDSALLFFLPGMDFIAAGYYE